MTSVCRDTCRRGLPQRGTMESCCCPWTMSSSGRSLKTAEIHQEISSVHMFLHKFHVFKKRIPRHFLNFLHRLMHVFWIIMRNPAHWICGFSHLLGGVVGVRWVDRGAVQSIGRRWRRDWRRRAHILEGVSHRRDRVGGLVR